MSLDNQKFHLSLVETDYQPAYYVSDAFYAVAFLIILIFLNVNAEKHKQSIFHAFKRIANPASGVFLLLMLSLGIEMGIFSNYVLVYLQEDLKATSAMIG